MPMIRPCTHSHFKFSFSILPIQSHVAPSSSIIIKNSKSRRKIQSSHLSYSLSPKKISKRPVVIRVSSSGDTFDDTSQQKVSEGFEVSGSPISGDGESVRKKNLAVFVSGGGSNFRAVHQAILKGDVHGQVVVLVTNKKDCGGAQYARENDIPVIIYPGSKGIPEGLSSDDLVAALSMYKIDFILLAGYLKLIPSELIRAYPNSILNIHPSLLPAFGGKGYYGAKVHKAVIASGARYSGPTIHYVDEHYDTGRILAQRIVPVLADDTTEELAARVLRQEHKMYVEVAAAVCEERVIWREDGVPIIRSKANPKHYS